MKATLTELRRDTGRVLGEVINGHRPVELTQHGETVKATARDIATAIRSVDQAG